jgi:hypothetical protein
VDVIDTTTMPGDDMDPDAIGLAAKKIRSAGAKVSKTTTATHTAWAKISGSYHAPEQGQLYEAMNPVKTEGETFSSDLDSASTALETFAETVRTIKAAVVKIRADVKTFEDKIADDGTIQPAGGYNPYGGGMKLRIQWNEDKGMVAEQHRLAKEINDQVDAMRTAETTCANSIADITGAAHVPTSGPKAPPAPPHIPDAQWYLTAPIDRKEGCGEQIAHAVVIDFAGGMVSGAAGLFGLSWSPTTGKFGNWWATLKGSWGGLGKFTLGTSPVLLGLLAATGHSKLALDSMKSVAAFGGDQFSIDPFAKDPTHRYKDQPYRAWAYTAVNVASWLLPPLKALTAAKAGKAAELAGDAAKAGDLAKAGEATRFGSAADLAKALRESGSLDKLGKVGELLKTKIAERVGKASDFSHTLDDLKTPELSKYDMDAGRAHPHTDTPPVHDVNPGTGHEPAGHPGDGAPDHRPASEHPTSDHPDSTPGHDGHPADHPAQPQHDPLAVKEREPDHPISAENKADYADAVEKRKQLAVDHTKDLHARDSVAKQLGVDTKKLTVGELDDTLKDLRKAHPEQRAKIAELEAATRREQRSMRGLIRASEDLGMDASVDYIKAHHGEVITGGERGAGKPGELDTIGLRENAETGRQTLTVAEAKGGSSRLGFRKVDGIRVQQGSTAYLNDLLHKDPKLRSYLDAHPDFARKLAAGEVDIEYKLVRARASGTVGVSNFKLDTEKLHLKDLAQSVSPTR